MDGSAQKLKTRIDSSLPGRDYRWSGRKAA
jgi:hypothetical protein